MTEKLRIGWIGLGRMGVPICRHIGAAGYPVTAHAHNDAGRDKAARLGLPWVDSLAKLAAVSDIVVSRSPTTRRSSISSPARWGPPRTWRRVGS